MLPKFKILGDPNNKNQRFSTDIIVDSLNQGAKNIGLYDDNGLTVMYDCLGNTHGINAHALITCYETVYPEHIRILLGSKPVFGVSKDNVRFIYDSGYKTDLVDYIHLGVDTKVWQPLEKRYMVDKFVVLSYTESLARSGLDILLEGFKIAFSGNENAVLYIKDRNANDKFVEYVHKYAKENKINLKYENRHINNIEGVKDVFRHADCHAYLNRSTTWGLTLTETMASGITTISPAYSGPREYIIDGFSGVEVDYKLSPINEDMPSLLDMGMRNYFFPARKYDYWAKPCPISVARKLKFLYENPAYNKAIAQRGSSFIKRFTWERSALMLAEGLSRYYKV